MPGSVPTSDFAGFVSSSCALARAAAIVPMFSLERCMAALHRHNVKADRSGLRALRPDAVAKCFLSVLRHQRLELGLGPFVLDHGWAGPAVDRRKLGPGVGAAHIDRPHRLDPWQGRLYPEQGRGLASLNAPPESLLG